MRKLLITFLSGVLTLGISIYPAMAFTKVSEMTDLEAPHWAYKAIQQCIERYQILDGFPDKTFKGSRNITRYEAAAAFYKIMLRAEQMVRQNMVNQEDLKLLKDLQQEFKTEIENLKKTTPNIEMTDKITKLEKELEKVKKDMGSLRFGGYLSAQMDDVTQDTFRPNYSTEFGLDMKVAVSDQVSVYSSWGGSFSSKMEEKKEEGKPTTKEEKAESSLGFGNAWLEYTPSVFLSPKFVFGYKEGWRWGDLINPGTSIPNKFGSVWWIPSSVSLGSPNLSSGARKRGIRRSDNVIIGGSVSEGPFSASLLTAPDIFAVQAGVNLGLAKLRIVADADQSWWVGEIVQDPMHNEIAILDIGDRNIGLSLQGAWRGLGNKFDFKAASALVNLSFYGFTIGGAAKYENESAQQVVAGGYFQTPDKWGEIPIPQIFVVMQEPLTYQNSTFFEGSLLKDKAGLLIALFYDNPIIPNLSVVFCEKSEILFPSELKDIISDTIAIRTDFSF